MSITDAQDIYEDRLPFDEAGLKSAGIRIVMERLCDPSIDIRDPSAGYSALHIAVIECDLEQVKSLLANGADVNMRDSHGRTPIFYINGFSEEGREIIKTLLDARPRLDICERHYGRLPFVCILGTGSKRAVKMLLDYGIDLTARDRKGDTAAHHFKGYYDHFGWIRHLNFDPNVKNSTGSSPLHYAAKLHDQEYAKILLEKGADPNLKNDDGLTPMFMTFQTRTMHSVKFLLENGADINKTLLPSGVGIVGYAVSKYGSFMSMDILRRIVIHPFVEHLAFHEAKGLPIERLLVKDIQVDAYVRRYYDECKKEIERMRSLKVSGNVSFLNILIGSVNQVSNYARDPKFVKCFKGGNINVNFPRYAESLKMQFEKAREMQRSKQNAANV